MSLQEKFNSFKLQQEKCQATLASIAVQAPSSRAVQPQEGSHHSLASTSSAPGKASAAIKFSSDTERLQLINAIRKAPIGAQIKRVIELLRKPKHHLVGKGQLLSLIRKFPEGLAISDVKDAYPSVMEDLQALKAAGQVWLLSNTYSQEDIVYPNDLKVEIKVDDDLKQLLRSIELPRDMLDIERDLLKSGMKPATNTAKRRAMAQVHTKVSQPKAAMKKRGVSKRRKLTNVHLPELFKHLNLPEN